MKATPTKCVDGKPHKWEYIGSDGEGPSRIEQKWCSKCGSYTEFYRVNGKNLRAQEDDEPYIQIPQVSQ